MGEKKRRPNTPHDTPIRISPDSLAGLKQIYESKECQARPVVDRRET